MSAPLAKPLLAPMPTRSLSYGASPVQQSRGASVFSRLVSSLRWVAEYPRRMAVIDELQRMTDRELNDIGLSRAEVREVFIRRRA